MSGDVASAFSHFWRLVGNPCISWAGEGATFFTESSYTRCTPAPEAGAVGSSDSCLGFPVVSAACAWWVAGGHKQPGKHALWQVKRVDRGMETAMQMVSLTEMVLSLSKAMDCVSSVVGNHHARVGFLAARLAVALGLDISAQRDLLIAGLLHDAGALSLKSRLDALQFETDGAEHATVGYRLLRNHERLQRVAQLVRHHHTPNAVIQRQEGVVDPLANILCLADRVDVLVRRDQPVAVQLPGICAKLRSSGEAMFRREYVEAFLDLSSDAEFAEQASSPGEWIVPLACTELPIDALTLDELVDFSRLFSQIIDFRSRFTATHSQGVAATAEQLAEMFGFDETERKLVHIAGSLHDLGKLAVPAELLEKPSALTEPEFERIKLHAQYSHDILGEVRGLDQVCEWAAHHHERMDGTGYPYRRNKSELSLGARILAVADVFTAITEDRPYRAGMDQKQAMRVLQDMARSQALDSAVSGVLLDSYDDFNELRSEVQRGAQESFQAFYRGE